MPKSKPVPLDLEAIKPPQHIIDLAIEVSGWSPCRSKRGVVIFTGENVVSHGHNYKPKGFECDGSEACKSTCRREAVHAEQQALMSAGSQAHASEMLHVKTVEGKLVASGGPSCVECSKLARAAGIAWFWLYESGGWRRYTMREFHWLSVIAGKKQAEAEVERLRTDVQQFVEWWHEHREGTPNAAYLRVDRFVADVERLSLWTHRPCRNMLS